MKTLKRFSLVAILCGCAILADAITPYAVTPADCASQNYNHQVDIYTAKMAAAQQAGNHDLLAQSIIARNNAQSKAKACAALNGHGNAPATSQ